MHAELSRLPRGAPARHANRAGHAIVEGPRVHAYALPSVKLFTAGVQADLKPAHFRRTRSTHGLSYEYASYLLHVHAGYIPARSTDAAALDDLARLLAERRATLAV